MDQAIGSLDHLPDDVGVVVGSVEIAATSQDDGLVDGVLEAVMPMLRDAGFVALAAMGAGGTEAVVVHRALNSVIDSSTRADG